MSYKAQDNLDSSVHMKEKSKKDVIFYDPSLTGKGKTYGLLSELAIDHGRTLIAVPSKALANEYKTLITDLTNHQSGSPDALYHVITSDEGMDEDVSFTREMLQRSIDKVNNAQSTYKIIITTHATLDLALKFGIHGIDGWDLYVDESMDMFKAHRYDLTEMSAGMFLESFQFSKSSYNGLMEISPSKSMKSCIESIVEGRAKDTFWSDDDNAEFLDYVQSSSFTSYVKKDDYEKAKDVSTGMHTSSTGRLFVLSAINPHVLREFSSVTILSSLYERSIMYKLLEIMGFTLKEKRFSRAKSLLHDNGYRLNIYYAMDGKNSKAYKSKLVSSGANKDYEDAIVQAFRRMVGSNRFIYNANVSSRDKQVYSSDYKGYAGENENDESYSVLLTAVAGVNSYDDYHHAIYTTARNMDDSEASVLHAFGIDKDFANDDRNLLSAYQFISRTSIRVKEAEDEVSFYVVDKHTAEFIQSLWPGASINMVHVNDIMPCSTNPYTYLKHDKKEYYAYMRFKAKFEDGFREFRKNSRERFVRICEEYGFTHEPAYKYITYNY